MGASPFPSPGKSHHAGLIGTHPFANSAKGWGTLFIGDLKGWATRQEKFGQPIQLELFNSTDWKSRVVWPLSMAGKQYFTFTELPPKKLIESLRRRIFGPVYEYAVSHEVREFIHEQRRLRPSPA